VEHPRSAHDNVTTPDPGAKEKRIISFAMPFYTKSDLLPRQARDRHTESSTQKEMILSQAHLDDPKMVRKTHLLRHFILKMMAILPRQAWDKYRER